MITSVFAMGNAPDRALPAKITALWTVFLLGTLFHTQLALMPLFHGLSVADSHTYEAVSLNAVMWFMLIFFTLPLLAIVGCVLMSSRLFRTLHFGLTLIYTGLNLLHLLLDMWIAVPGYQQALMGLLLLVGLLINWVSYRWMRLARSAVRLHPSG
ncbi:MAG: hypothetical protein AAFN18_04585 [Cyanobacteria bacterium J06554_6]